MLGSDWGIGDLIQLKPLLERAVIKNMKTKNFYILRQMYKNQNLYIYVWGGSLYSVSLELLIFNNFHISTQIYKPTSLFVHVKGGGLFASLFDKSVIQTLKSKHNTISR